MEAFRGRNKTTVFPEETLATNNLLDIDETESDSFSWYEEISVFFLNKKKWIQVISKLQAASRTKGSSPMRQKRFLSQHEQDAPKRLEK